MCKTKTKTIRTEAPTTNDLAQSVYADGKWQAKLSELLQNSNFGISPHARWLREIWSIRAAKWQAIFGDTLRREVCVPLATGDELVALYREAWASFLNLVEFPPTITSHDLEHQSVAAGGGRKKLGRWLSSYLQEVAKLAPTESSAIVGKIQERVKSANGATIVLSAHPLDILLTSDFTAGWTSCHAWAASPRCHAAGNFAYVQSPETLVAFLYEGKPDFGQLPKKKWRQMIFIEDQTAYFNRQYRHELCELHHSVLRRMTAEILTGASDPPWRFVDVSEKRVFIRAEDKNPYLYDTDYIYGALIVGDDRAQFSADDFSPTILVAAAICPKCNSQHSGDSESILCEDCGQSCTRLCDSCGNDVDIASEDDWDDWASDDSGVYCPSCARDLSFCEVCERYITDSLHSISISRNGRTRSVDACADCCCRNGYAECSSCGEMSLCDESDCCADCQPEESEESEESDVSETTTIS